MGTILRPVPLNAQHDVSDFANGKHPELDLWLKERALPSEGLSARCYVICTKDAPCKVIGYYALSTAMAERLALPSAKLRRGMPERVPLLLIGRLAIDASMQGHGYGADLLSDAVRRCCTAAEIVAARAIITHAIDEAAVQFYAHHGFRRSLFGERLMVLPIEDVKLGILG
ncbi:GNAT superfamily N-acetyltransferase [Rhizomicrobium palustre]|uniref:GNAT superfamily N-acetyltransferase n=1 Tax=Rhizomicrobium palustre TaxID=189966 RepID=A0A846MZ09_9PROT|nr:GNAT family N-acetyltransferase [Rhizomicrobium palustre]NIK88868.1 GNAT superfamily N-acetyltransferase [Rhizomicrobium palustre]